VLERDLQDYLYSNPEVIFPGQIVQEKHREFYVQGRRIDLLFRVDDVRYIIELKAVPLTREHIGQVAEYYGLMKSPANDCKMVLVAPSIPEFRKVFLEEIGIRCVEIQSIPSSEADMERLRKDVTACRKKEQVEAEIASWIPQFISLQYAEMATSVTKASLAASHRVLQDSIGPVRNAFSEYELLPVKMARAESSDVICAGIPGRLDQIPQFKRGGAWWAYSFGHSETMPKNDVPNISAVGMPWCFDLAVNSELRPSQAIVRKRIADDPAAFDKIVMEHGGIQFQALLKLEHQPRFYHWIRCVADEPGTWTASKMLGACDRIDREYETLKWEWISCLEECQPGLSASQATHLRRHNGNKQPNLALRFVRSFPSSDAFWSMPYPEQCARLVQECQRLKPIIDFFLR